MWEGIVLKNGLIIDGMNFGGPIPAEDQHSALATAAHDTENPQVQSGNQLSAQSVHKDVTPGEDTPVAMNSRALKHVVSQLPNTLNPFFQGKLFYGNLNAHI